MNNTKRAVNIVEAYFILSLITKQKTKRIECLQALSKANRNEEVKDILKPFCNAAGNTVFQFCDTFSSRGNSNLLEESIVYLVRQVSELSGLYLNQLQNCEREKMVIDFVKRWEEAQIKFLIPSPVSMINQWVLI
nr:hypothetical protein [Tanacetum cinerariifolium]